MFAAARRSTPRFARSFADKANPRVYFDMTIGEKKAGRITFEVSAFASLVCALRRLSCACRHTHVSRRLGA